MTSTNDLITDAMRILAMDEDEREQALTAWLDGATQKLAALYYTSKAALARADQYASEAERWALMATRERKLADYCAGRARDLLEAERRAAGHEDSDPYKVTLPNGVKPGLVLNPPSVQIVNRDAIPKAYWRQPPTPPPEPDKRAILDALKLGSPIEGVELTRGQRFDWGEPRKPT